MKSHNSDKSIVVLGASGRVGSVVANQLLDLGHKVIAVARHADGLKELAAKGADVMHGAIEDQNFLNDAFSRAHAAFVMTPGDNMSQDLHKDQRVYSEHIAEALRKSQVMHVVFLSSWGAELPEKTGTIYGSYLMEQLLNGIEGVHCLHLRSVWFMDNFIFNIGLIKMAGINGLALDADFSFPCIDAGDIGVVAASHLSELNFTGKSVRYLQGPRDYTMNEVTKILGKVIGKPSLRYVRLPDSVMLQGLESTGNISHNVAQLLIETNQKINTSKVHAEKRSNYNTTPTTLESFARNKFLPAFRAEKSPSRGKRIQGTLLRIFLSITVRN